MRICEVMPDKTKARKQIRMDFKDIALYFTVLQSWYFENLP